MKHKGFKIIAIKPLSGCNPKYLKVLKTNQIYYLLNNYKIDDNDNITYKELIPSDFYNVNGIDITVSAIVGKNGSGKSTIIELLFRIINNFAHFISKSELGAGRIPGLITDIFFHTDALYKMHIHNTEITVHGYNKNGDISLNKLENFSLKNFFYTIAINYSHYAYNTNDLEEANWLDTTFHKNDGYQMPLVINPKRDNGNIDINTENHLAKARLISNLLHSTANSNFNFKKITDKLEATALILKLNKNKDNNVLYSRRDKKGNIIEEIKFKDLNVNHSEILNELNNTYNFGYKSLDKDEYQTALNYLVYKIVSIAITYDYYSVYFSKEKRNLTENSVKEFLKELITDSSHITFKLKQTLNFLRYKHIMPKSQTINLNDLSERISNIPKRKGARISTIELIPPPIFTIDILLKPSDDSTTQIKFKQLSSGEKQMTYSVSSLLYHITNINSITPGTKRISYKFINVVFEEIELYFHPDMQRNYLNYILKSIEQLDLSRLKGINLCFITHSPFILSDIPDCNILFLSESGIPLSHTNQIKTFGGNIHELLSNVFFLNNGLIGEFAKNKIQNIINQLQDEHLVDTNEEISKEDLLKEIDLIGEPFLRLKLSQMYYNKYESEHQKQKRIIELKAELKRLEGE